MHVTGVASVTVLAVLLSTLPASAQTTDAALADLRVRAEQGDAEAQFNLGLMYEQEPMESPSVAMPEEAGWSSDDSKDWYFGGGPSPQTAEEFVLAQSYISFGYGQSAADALQPYIDIRMAEFKRKLETDAAADLDARSWREGVQPELWAGMSNAVPQDDAEAVRWYRLAAAQGNALAQNNLGLMYDDGRGVPEDDAEAVRWYRLAAAQGNASAQFNLGLMCANGRGVPQDNVSAHMWLNLATAQSMGEEREQSATMRDAVAERMTREDLSEAQRRAREWSPE